MLTDFCQLNIHPLVTCFRDRIYVGNKLKMSVEGRTNMIKMILMPQLLYLCLISVSLYFLNGLSYLMTGPLGQCYVMF